MFLYLVRLESSRIFCCKVYKWIGVVFRWFFPRSVLWISSVYWSATKLACVGGGRVYSGVTEVTSEVSTEVVFVTERLRVSGRGRKWRRSSVFTSLVELVVKSFVELLRWCGINILVLFSDIPVFWLDNKLPTTLNIELVTKFNTPRKWRSSQLATSKQAVKETTFPDKLFDK